MPIFRDLSDEFITYLRDRVQLVSYEPNTTIFRQGDVADAFYLVRMGHVKVIENYADGQSMVLSYLSRSQFFGEIGLLGNVESHGDVSGDRSRRGHPNCERIRGDDQSLPGDQGPPPAGGR